MTKSKGRAGPRIPAPTLAIIHITIAILLGWLVPMPMPAPIFVHGIGLGLAALGFILGVLAMIEFKWARAALDAQKSTRGFVTTGIYRYTRNPIYLGFVFMLIGLPLSIGTPWGVILVWPFVTLTNNLIINSEEAHLQQTFNAQYTEYISRVSRWL